VNDPTLDLPDWKVGDPVAVTKQGHPARRGTITRVMSLHVMVSCDSSPGRLVKFSKKTGRKVAPFAQASVWIRPWTSRDDDSNNRQIEQEIRKSLMLISGRMGATPAPTLLKVQELVGEVLELMSAGGT
jgi:hypothetical protein